MAAPPEPLTIPLTRALEQRLTQFALEPLQAAKDGRRIDPEALAGSGQRCAADQREHDLEIGGRDPVLRLCNG